MTTSTPPRIRCGQVPVASNHTPVPASATVPTLTAVASTNALTYAAFHSADPVPAVNARSNSRS